MSDIAPSIVEQGTDILEFVLKKCKEFDKECYDPPLIPRCESVYGPARLGLNAGRVLNEVPMSLYHSDSFGITLVNARDCPHCGTLEYKTQPLGTVVICLHCTRKYVW